MSILEKLQSSKDEFIAIRRYFHQHPELSNEEYQTAAKIAELLSSWGIEVHTGIGKTGVVGVLKAGNSSHCIALRADMDALAIPEANTFAHASKNPGVMHACGHDGHITTVLMAAHYLAQTKNFDGTVLFVFQPAEENGKGARAMMADGLMERFAPECCIGCHNWPETPKMTIGINHAEMMASNNRFTIEINGKGSHGAMPNLSVDPIFVANQIYTAIQGIISRNKAANEIASLSVCQMHAGDAYNVVPDTAFMEGSFRTFSDALTDKIAERLQCIAENTAAAHEAKATFSFDKVISPTINDAKMAQVVIDAAKALHGEAVIYKQPAVMPSEDFCIYAQKIPSAFFFVGVGTDGNHREAGHGPGPCLLHNPSYDFNDNALILGASVFAKVVEDYLQ